MPVYDHRNIAMKDLPDQVCLVLKPTQNPAGDSQEHQSGALNIDLCAASNGMVWDSEREKPSQHRIGVVQED